LTAHLPSAFVHSLSGLDHFDAEAFQAVHESGDQLVSVHMNPEKSLLLNEEWPGTNFDAPFDISGKVPWATDAYYLAKRPSFTLEPLFHAGTYYVQEASGMFLSFALRKAIDLTQKLNVLDLCAAPGGKSTMIQSHISKDSLLVSNEVIKTRVPVLDQNMTKWGYANGIVTNNDPVHFKKIPGFFDLMLIDAPCSGSGLFRKDPDAVKTWSADLVKLCSRRQQRIIADVWDALKEEGILIYSTCSYSKEENEDMLDQIFRQYECLSIPLLPDPSWNIVETKSDQAGAYGYRFYPYKLAGEGFFLSVIQKKNPVAEIKINKTARNTTHTTKFVEQQISRWIKPGDYHYFTVGEINHLLPSGLANEFQVLKNALYLKKAGIRIGKPGENVWIPDHELALAAILRDDIPSLNLTKENALKFLRGESFETEGIDKGWQLVRYHGFGVGWVKVLDNRMNNYYPKSWRIRQ
jgi:16S rRNA C967 or C1407 C5-methylase (RsmB/RsmF family)/NOL1/NOP2/fmu family ribosome biogenesis protein